MPEPTSSAAAVATLAGGAVAVPVLTAFGVPLGVRPDILLAGFSGSFAAMVLLNTVPRSGDSVMELARSTGRRLAVAGASALFAAYCAKFVAVAMPDEVLVGVGFLLGAGAQTLLPWALSKLKGGAA